MIREDVVIFGPVAVVAAVVIAVAIWGPRPIDYGACLASHGVARHEDARLDPVFDFDGNITLAFVAARDWTEVVCDRWEFPNGRLEAAP